jgi:hypothetical protein
LYVCLFVCLLLIEITSPTFGVWWLSHASEWLGGCPCRKYVAPHWALLEPSP